MISSVHLLAGIPRKTASARPVCDFVCELAAFAARGEDRPVAVLDQRAEPLRGLGPGVGQQVGYTKSVKPGVARPRRALMSRISAPGASKTDAKEWRRSYGSRAIERRPWRVFGGRRTDLAPDRTW